DFFFRSRDAQRPFNRRSSVETRLFLDSKRGPETVFHPGGRSRVATLKPRNRAPRSHAFPPPRRSTERSRARTGAHSRGGPEPTSTPPWGSACRPDGKGWGS